MTDTAKIEGVTVKMNGTDRIIPPLNFKALKAMRAEIETLTNIDGAPSDTQMATVVKVVKAALIRNYPNITDEEVEDGIDMGNLQAVLHATMGRKGGTTPGE